MAQVLIHPTAATSPSAVEALELATGRIAVLGAVAAELVLRTNCTCDAYPYPHRTGGGTCDECGCPEAPRCHHWAPDVDAYGTGDNDHIEYERIDP